MRRSLSLSRYAFGLACMSSIACSSNSDSPGSAGSGNTGNTGNTGAMSGAGNVAGATAGGATGLAGAGGASTAAGAGGVGGTSGGASAGAAGGTSMAGGTGTGVPTTSMFKVDSVAKWRGNATAAYSIIHDDVCDDSALGVFSSAQPLLKARGLTAGFGVIVGECDTPTNDGDAADKKWNSVISLAADGNDIFSHSWDHPCVDGYEADGKTIATNPFAGDACGVPSSASGDGLTVYATPSQEQHELGDAATTLKAKLLPTVPDFANDFFIFPYDYCNESAIAFLKGIGYLGARCGLPDDTSQAPVSPFDFADGFAVFYDVFGPAYSHYVIDIPAAMRGGSCQSVVQYCNAPYASSAGDPGCNGTAAMPADACCPATMADPTSCINYVNNQYVDDTIANGGWGIREFHGFSPGDDESGFETISEADYSTHLDYVKTKKDAGSLWVSGPSPVLRYRFAREACALPTVTGGNTLHFDAPSADCAKYKTIMSYLIETTDSTDPALISVKQGGKSLPVKKLSAGHFVVDANPTLGDAVLSL